MARWRESWGREELGSGSSATPAPLVYQKVSPSLASHKLSKRTVRQGGDTYLTTR